MSPDDLAAIDRWAANLGERVPSRTRPLAGGAGRHDPASGLFWYVIVADDREVGTVWIERLGGQSEGRLGVFLGEPSDFGCGFGQAALRLAVDDFRNACPGDSISLHVRCSNALAIGCYRAVGFETVNFGTKTLPSGERIPFRTMVLSPHAELRHA